MTRIKAFFDSGESHSDFIKLVRFAVVGGICYFVNLAVFAVVHEAGVHYLVAALISFLVSALVSFRINMFWTFSHADHDAQAHRSIIWAFVGFIFAASMLRFFVEGLGMDPIAAQALGVCCGLPINFVLQKVFVFKN